MKKKKFITAVLLSFTLLTSGCSIGGLNSVINELHGSLVGNSYTIDTYDNYGNKTLETTGKKISITGNKIETVSYDDTGKAIKGYDLSSVITITIDGKEIESCGDTCIFMQDGKSRIVVIKSQLGQPITAFSGDNVYWEIPEDLPKMTKLMIDGKALYIHRANYQIIDSDLL